ncbi:MAG: DUF5131 family protein [Lentisphaerota bacterium]
MNNSLIQWPRAKYWSHAYNPFVGCEKISEGCQNCYAAVVVKRFGINGGSFAPQLMPNAKPPKSGVVFVVNMTDIFGEWNSDENIHNCLTGLSAQVTNLVLTKRSSRMQCFLSLYGDTIKNENILYGVTCENQPRADERIPHLLAAGVQNRWLSLEPLLGPIDFKKEWFYADNEKTCRNRDLLLHRHLHFCPECLPQTCGGINGIIVGAESIGNKAGRECKIEWIEHIVEYCRLDRIPVFVKQLHIGGKLVDDINKFPEHLRIRQVPWF